MGDEQSCGHTAAAYKEVIVNLIVVTDQTLPQVLDTVIITIILVTIPQVISNITLDTPPRLLLKRHREANIAAT